MAFPPTAAPSSPSRPFWSVARLLMVGGALAFPAAALALGASACAVNDIQSVAGAGGGAGQGPGTSGSGGQDADATIPDAQPDVEEPTFAELCGKGACSPGLPDDCAAGSAAGSSPSSGSKAAGDDGPASDGIFRGAPSPVGCRVVAGEDGEPESVCAAAGQGTSDAPCQDALDCRPGHACIPTEASNNDAPAGICRQYCCADLESCPPDAYCAPRPLVEEPGLTVPVCVALTPCELLKDGSCPVGTACSVVRETGATSCVVPGKGTLCQPCACAEGFVCAVHTGLCQRLCQTDGTGDACGTGFCQGGSAGYPTGFGVCVGGDQVCD